jgi:hypothetical protein
VWGLELISFEEIFNFKKKLGIVAHTCNLSSLGDGDMRIMI